MPKGHHIKLTESQYIRDIAQIMSTRPGPWTRKMLAAELGQLYPNLSIQEIRIEVSGAIQTDRFCNKRFKIAKPGWWDLVEREGEGE